MTLYLSAEDVRGLATSSVVMGAARAAVSAERAGRTVLPPRLDVDLPRGFLRTMPAAFDDVMGVKVMTLVKGLGTRYLVLVYSQLTGELVALLDADEITRLRTAATTALAGEMLARKPVAALGLIGSGFEAEGHLRLLAELWPLERVLVFSRSNERRSAFAARMSEELDIDVTAAGSSAEAVAECAVSVLATKSSEPVVDGAEFPTGAVVLSIGSTRPDLRELDERTLRRSALLLVDNGPQVRNESGDIIEGLSCGALTDSHIVPMAALDSHTLEIDGERDLLSFKSVGTAVHDLSLATALFRVARDGGAGRELGELTGLKPFADGASGMRAPHTTEQPVAPTS